jgi:hypothetical protein
MIEGLMPIMRRYLKKFKNSKGLFFLKNTVRQWRASAYLKQERPLLL